MAYWTSRQRRTKKLGTLRKERVDKLNEIGFLWSACSCSERRTCRTDACRVTWDRSLAMYCDFVEENRICGVPETNSKIYNWIRDQRRLKRLGTLRKERVDKLNEIGFLWSPPSVSWDRNFAMYSDFVEENGICGVPKTHSKMYNWIREQRKMNELGKLKKYRMDTLDKIGFLWSARCPPSVSEQSNFSIPPTFARSRATSPDLNCEFSLDCMYLANHEQLLENNNEFASCSTVASTVGRVLPLDTPLFNEDVSMQGCDHRYGSPLGHKKMLWMNMVQS